VGVAQVKAVQGLAGRFNVAWQLSSVSRLPLHKEEACVEQAERSLCLDELLDTEGLRFAAVLVQEMKGAAGFHALGREVDLFLMQRNSSGPRNL
jgi:hypothetical protein